MSVRHHSCLFVALVLLIALGVAPAGAAESTVLLKTTRSWDGTAFPAYPQGQPEITVLRIVIPPHSTLAWHHHPVINAAYVQQGRLMVEKHDHTADGPTTCSLIAGDVLPELVDQVHRGYTGDEAATLIVFYAGRAGSQITVPDVFPVGPVPTRWAPPCSEWRGRGT
ncbi:cupin domain-containing protein [Dyella koreensis]|uniref:Cupin domain-containing protein n=1 Tax=Dyella koreensis TaxID=311235 RepID=A0ABW8K3C0_9GAMM